MFLPWLMSQRDLGDAHRLVARQSFNEIGCLYAHIEEKIREHEFARNASGRIAKEETESMQFEGC